MSLDLFAPTTVSVIETAMFSNSVVFLNGDSGIGKTTIAHDLAEKHDTKVFILECNHLSSKDDLTGVRTLKDEHGNWSQQFFPHMVVMNAIHYARQNPDKPAILVLDEINRSNADVTNGVMTATTNRGLGRETFPDNLYIMATGNDRGNIVPLDEASMSRFLKLSVKPSAESWLRYMGDNVHPTIKKVLEQFPEYIFMRPVDEGFLVDGSDDDDADDNAASIADLDTEEDMAQITTPRTIEALNTFLKKLSDQQLQSLLVTQTDDQSNMLNDVVQGYVGKTPFATAVVKEIADTATSSMATSQRNVDITAPAAYSAVTQATSIDQISDTFRDMSTEDRSASMAFLLFDQNDNRLLIEQLAAIMEEVGEISVTRGDLGKLTDAAQANRLDNDNLQALSDTNTQISTQLSILTMLNN